MYYITFVGIAGQSSVIILMGNGYQDFARNLGNNNLELTINVPEVPPLEVFSTSTPEGTSNIATAATMASSAMTTSVSAGKFHFIKILLFIK